MKFNTNNMKTTVTMAIISLSATIAIGQKAENLVSNGSFESIGAQPKKIGSIESANGWTSPTGARADLFTSNKKVPDIDVPSNIYGSEQAQDGSNYAGIVTYSHNNKVPRTYVTNKLEVPLQKGEKYCVQFYVSMAEASSYSSNQIGAHFSKKVYASAAKESVIEKTHVMDEDNRVFKAPFGWDKICGVFEAEGGEKYIMIGNFTSNENTKNERNKKSTTSKVVPIAAAYYYLDNISVTLVDGKNQCDCAQPDPTEGFSKTVYQKAINLTDDMTPTKKIESLKVFFGFGKTDFTTAGTDVLDIIVKELKANSSLKIQINGYSDAAEDAAAEDKEFFTGMDNKRVTAIYDYLKEKGITPGRLIASPQGSAEQNSEITSTDEDDIKQAKNRRVEFKVR
jgi:outer membrane protein OmpA-like peptidoglycan-associated protein